MFAHPWRYGEQMLHVPAVALKLHYNSSTNLEQTFLVKTCVTPAAKKSSQHKELLYANRQSFVFAAASNFHNFNISMFSLSTTLNKGFRALGPHNPLLQIYYFEMHVKGLISQFLKKSSQADFLKISAVFGT